MSINFNSNSFLLRSKKYARLLNYDIQALDIGIALSHYEIGLKHYGKKYHFVVYNNIKEIEDMQYVISVELSK